MTRALATNRALICSALAGLLAFVSNLAKLDGLPAISVKFQYKEAERTVAEEHVVAQRSGILYPIGPRTTPGAYLADRIQYQKIVNSFRWRRIHYCS